MAGIRFSLALAMKDDAKHKS
ncbi:uncharacterized protein G2W53_022173 [Senna tora]|uniref:Uncharacterized protein n=1 Tax=Senna tora TaxID=362788 RepID=A0A834WNY6_9FABA|nr:uncharacterized protein G2W53_022173 [Senna tora]